MLELVGTVNNSSLCL